MGAVFAIGGNADDAEVELEVVDFDSLALIPPNGVGAVFASGGKAALDGVDDDNCTAVGALNPKLKPPLLSGTDFLVVGSPVGDEPLSKLPL